MIEACNAESGLHIQAIYDDSACFPSLLAHYGMFRNAKNYLALVGSASTPDLRGICGYYGQKLVLALQQMELNTCWIGGSYSKKKCSLFLCESFSPISFKSRLPSLAVIL